MSPARTERFSFPVDLQEHMERVTTFRLGGPCRGLVSCDHPDRLPDIWKHFTASGERAVVIGEGSNLLVSDRGVDAWVIRFVSETPRIERAGDVLTVSGCTRLEDLAAWSAREGIADFVTCAGIPGTVGAAVAGNAGAYGEQITDTLRDVTVMDAAGRVRVRARPDIRLAYRHSDLPEKGQIALTCRFNVRCAPTEDLMRRRDAIMRERRNKHPDWRVTPCAGSFFKNVEPTSKAERRRAAGWFLEQVGAKNMCVGGAAVFPKHANIIVKRDASCRADDVRRLSDMMAAAVKEQFGIALEREVRMMGVFEEGD